MRVLLVNHRYPPDSLGGVERYTQTLAAELIQLGDGVSVVTRRFGPTPVLPQMLRERRPDRPTVYRLVGGELHPDRPFVHDERLAQLFLRATVEAAPDVVHVNHLIGQAPRLVEIAHRLRVAVVLTLHDFYFACTLVHLQKTSGELCRGPDDGRECARTCFVHEGEGATTRWGLRTAYFRRLLALAERVITPSEYMASYFRAFGADPARLRVIPNGVSIARSVPRRRADGRQQVRSGPTFAYFGTVSRHKGVHMILDALGTAGFEAVDLRVLGETPDDAYVHNLRERAAAIPGLRLQLHGAYDPAELPSLLDGVDCVVVPSQVPESFSITTREAFVQGIPVVATRLGALPETVLDGENGFTFDHRHPDELAAILRRLVEDGDLLVRLRDGARRTRVTTLAENARAVRAVYEEAREAVTRGDGPCQGDLEELHTLQVALSRLGLATPHGVPADAQGSG